MSPQVSYVVTVYNKAAFLPYVLEGLRRQQGEFEREFIFVDDGSTDGSAGLIRSLGTELPNLKVIEQANSGPARAINVGLAAARGQWVKGLDGDDILVPTATLALLKAAETEKAGLVYGAYAVRDQLLPLDTMLETIENWQSVEPAATVIFDDHLPQSLKHARMNPSCWLADREMVQRCGGADERIFIQDYSLELRMAAEGKRFVHISNPIFLCISDIEGRLSDNARQILHDCNLAVANLFADRPELAKRYAHVAANRVLGRSWHWARRQENVGMLSASFLRYLKAKLRLARPTDFLASCADFGQPIRRPTSGG